jgi:hypothetical protein
VEKEEEDDVQDEEEEEAQDVEEEKTEESVKDEEDEVEEEEKEHPDLFACRPCGLVFAHTWGLKDHHIRGYPVDEPLAKKSKREHDGLEVTYGYELK